MLGFLNFNLINLICIILLMCICVCMSLCIYIICVQEPLKVRRDIGSLELEL